MAIDLFGNTIEEKALTATQRMSTRQSIIRGRDIYTTEPRDIDRFVKTIQKDCVELLSPKWEPAAGRGDISKTLMKYGYNVMSTDIFAYRDKFVNITTLDFLACTECIGNCKTIFTNPPFNIQEHFLIHALSFGVDVIFFARLSFLSSIRRLKIYEKYNPAYVYVYSARARCYKNGETNKNQNMIDYCVIMWKPPYKRETVLRWIA
jgi:hypothetical protein